MHIPNPPKIHLNEHLAPRLSKALRKRGYDVTSSQETGMLTEPDRQQLAFAVSEQRAILTFNTDDFIALHNEYLSAKKEHWGIILSTRVSIKVLLHRLLRLLDTLPADELKNQMRWLNEFK
jgi:predicted nuclease of predicted toxin-antitoxin system